LPSPRDDPLVRTLSYLIFLGVLSPLIFSGEIHDAIERVVVTQQVLVLGYFTFLGPLRVSSET
jgi:hypothetical protein